MFAISQSNQFNQFQRIFTSQKFSPKQEKADFEQIHKIKLQYFLPQEFPAIQHGTLNEWTIELKPGKVKVTMEGNGTK